MVNMLKECTGLAETAQCYQIMENHEWNLQAAVDFVLNHLQEGTSDNPITIADEYGFGDLDGESEESSSEPVSIFRPITIEVLYNELRNKIIMNSGDTIEQLKSRILDTMGVPINRQVIEELSGLDNSMTMDNLATGSLTVLHLRDSGDGGFGHNVHRFEGMMEIRFAVRRGLFRTMSGRLRQSYPALRHYNIQFPSSTTIKEAKQLLEGLCNVPVEAQEWTRHVHRPDDTQVGSFLRNHATVTVRSTENIINQPGARASAEIPMTTSDESDICAGISDEFSAQPTVPTNNTTSTYLSLLPDNSKDDTHSIEKFVQNFAESYGDTVPTMYIGSLANAIRDSLMLPIKERRLLAIYIHNVRSICVNVFCNQIMMNDFVHSFLLEHYILWPWDVSNEANRDWLLANLRAHFGPFIVDPIARLPIDQFPVIVVLSRTGSVFESVGIITGSENVESVVGRLTAMSDQFELAKEQEVEKEIEREHRNNIQKEQDMAYQTSLVRDKERVRKIQEEARLKEKAEEEQRENERRKLQRQQTLQSELPEEPSLSDAKQIFLVRIRLPNGESLSRNFESSDPLKYLFAFVGSKGYFIEEFKLLTSYPRVDVAQKDPNITLTQAGIHERDLLTLERRLQ